MVQGNRMVFNYEEVYALLKDRMIANGVHGRQTLMTNI